MNTALMRRYLKIGYLLIFIFLKNNCLAQFCTGSLGVPVVNITFGSGSSNPGGQIATIVPGASTTYNYESRSVGFPPANVIFDGSYSIINGVPANGAWFQGASDHTGNLNGYMAFFNSSETPGEFYRQTVSGLCAGTTYEFAAWVANVVNATFLPSGVPPNITFKILNPSNQQVLNTINSGDIPNGTAMKWSQYSLLFTTPPDVNSVDIVLANNNVGGNARPGNDLALDDITFRACGPTTKASFSNYSTIDTLLVNKCNNIDFYGSISGNLTNPSYQWQMSIDSGVSFNNIQNASNLNFSIPTIGQGNYQFQLLSSEAGNIGTLNCRFISNKLKLIANCQLAGKSSIINDYTTVLSLDICKNQLIVEDANKYNKGDTVLIIQMKGATIDSSNTILFGNIVNYGNAGNYEMNIVKNKEGNSVELQNTLLKQYDVQFGKVQLIRVPYFKNINLSDTLTCLPWDGNKGGVLVLNVEDTIELKNIIDVSGKGFKGAQGVNQPASGYNCNENEFYYPPTGELSSPKGEGIATISSSKSYGKGKIGNGGGGGNSHNGGGGGGANAGKGGKGGFQFEGSSFSPVPCNNVVPFDNGGFPGIDLQYDNLNNKIYLGGGGGAGHANNPEHFLPSGGNGGGIIIISANVFKGNNKNIIAKGSDGAPCLGVNTAGCHEGMGGGGAGGTILIKTKIIMSDAVCDISGGNGADMVASAGLGLVGPGGGGGGGICWISNTALPNNITTILNGGVNGKSTFNNNNPWGATQGQNGSTLFNLKIPVATIPFKSNIDSVRIKDSLTSCKNFDFKGLAYTNKNAIQSWNWNFGDGANANTQNTSHTYTGSGNFSVKLTVTDINGCIDSISRTVFTNGFIVDFTQVQDVCNPQQIQYKISDSTFTNPSWTFGDGNSSNNRNSILHNYTDTGLYLVKLTVQKNGCIDSIQKRISIGYVPANIILTPDTTLCFGKALQLKTQFDSSLNFCWSPSGFLNNTAFAQPTTTPPSNITYTLFAAANTGNLITNGNFNAGNTGFTTDYVQSATSPAIAADGNYLVANTSNNAAPLAADCKDHTTATGNMLLVRSNNITEAIIWKQNINIEPNTNYEFSTWVQSFLPAGNAKLQLSINGNPVGDTIKALASNCLWIKYSCVWNSGNTSSAAVSITNKNGVNTNDYFALDDISFFKHFIQKDTVKISIEKAVVKASNDTTVCEGSRVQLMATGAASYTWVPVTAVNNANIGNPFTIVLDTTQYLVNGTSSNGCIAADTVNIYTKPSPTITKSTDTTICKNSTVQLFANGAASYQWIPAGTLNNASIFNPVASPVVTTYYKVTATGINGCNKIDSVLITITPDPVFTISPDDSTCFNTPVQLKATGGNQYNWSPSSFVSDATIANPFASNSSGATYTVIIKENVCNIIDTLSTSITVLPIPVINASKKNDVDCVSINAQLLGTGAGQYLWQPAATLNSNSIVNPLATPASTTLYTVTGTDLVTKCAATDTVTVFVNKSGEAKYFIPAAFTPNGDIINDCWKITILGNLTDFELSIYNRFGELVFFTKNTNACWDGTFKGKAQNAGNFVYTFKAKNLCREDARKGNLLLIR